MREAWRKIDRTTAQLTLIAHHHLKNVPAVRRFIQTSEQEMKLLTNYRKHLYKKINACHDTAEKEALTGKHNDCTAALAQLRKEKKTADGIDLPAMKEKIQIEERIQQEQHTSKKQQKRGYER